MPRRKTGFGKWHVDSVDTTRNHRYAVTVGFKTAAEVEHILLASAPYFV